MKSTRRILGHSLVHLLVRLHRSLIRSLRTARFARALRCAHSFACSLTPSLPSSWESGIFFFYFLSTNAQVLTEGLLCDKSVPRACTYSSLLSCSFARSPIFASLPRSLCSTCFAHTLTLLYSFHSHGLHGALAWFYAAN